MARVKQSVAQVAVKLSAADLAALDELVRRHEGRELPGIDQVRNRSDILRVAIRTLAFLTEPLDDAEILHLQELANRFGTTPVLVVSAMLNDANARAIVKRNLDELLQVVKAAREGGIPGRISLTELGRRSGGFRVVP